MHSKDVIQKLNESSYAFRSVTRETVIATLSENGGEVSKEDLLVALDFSITKENCKNREYINHLMTTIYSNVDVLMLSGEWPILNTLSKDLLKRTITVLKDDKNYTENVDNILYGMVDSLENDRWFADLPSADKLSLKRMYTTAEQNHQDFYDNEEDQEEWQNGFFEDPRE